MKIVTFEHLQQELQKYLLTTAEIDKVCNEKDVIRFIAAQRAHELNDMGRRDTINMFVEGLAPMGKGDVVDWLESVEECAEDDDDARPDWDDLFEDFYGPSINKE